jgi:hypothetical protein
MWPFSRKKPSSQAPDFMLERVRDSASGIMRSLLTLQINTIEKEGMVGGLVPALPHALLDIARAYITYLQNLGVHFNQPGNNHPVRLISGKLLDEDLKATQLMEGEAAPPNSYEVLCAADLFPTMYTSERDAKEVVVRLTPATFHVLREAATWARINPPPESPPEQAVLRRIIENCDAIKQVLKRKAARQAWSRANVDSSYGPSRLDLRDNPALLNFWYEVPPSDALIIRHAWEIGTEVILAQTVVQLTGDIVTRLHPRMKNAPETRAMHQVGIDTALGHWHTLFGFVAQLARNIITPTSTK